MSPSTSEGPATRGPMARRRAGSRRFRVFASVAVFVAVALVAEGGARVIGATLPGWSAGVGGVMMIGSDTRLWAMAPGTWPNGATQATVNAWGLRGEVPEVPRPAGRQRILVVGDSSFFGHGIADDQTIPVRLEAELRAGGADVDVFNGAIPGYSTEQTLRLLDEVGWRHEPTLLVVGNLWSDNNIDAFRDVDLLQSVGSRTNPLMRSAFVTLAASWIDRVRGGTGAHLVTWTHDSTWPTDQDRRVALQDYAHNLDTMVHRAREHGAGVAFVAPVNRGLAEGRYREGAIWDVYFDAQAQVAAWHGLPVVSAAEAMAADPAAADAKFVDVMHPSALGAQLMAQGIAHTLTASGWPGVALTGRAEPFDPSGLTDSARDYALPMERDGSLQSELFPREPGAATSHGRGAPQGPPPRPGPGGAAPSGAENAPPGR